VQLLVERKHMAKLDFMSKRHDLVMHVLEDLLDLSSLPGDISSLPEDALQEQLLSNRDNGSLILYTSGTTGPPKGVLHTHRCGQAHQCRLTKQPLLSEAVAREAPSHSNSTHCRSLQAQMSSLADAWQWQSEDRILNTLPLHHIHGLVNGVMTAHYVGAAVHFAPFSAPHVWRSIMQGEPSVYMGVPTMYAHLLRVYNKLPAEQQSACRAGAAELRLTVCGSSACPPTVMHEWQELSGSVSHCLLLEPCMATCATCCLPCSRLRGEYTLEAASPQRQTQHPELSIPRALCRDCCALALYAGVCR
jgi:acyl-CoA synthetase (AMP-forming)/AMP-acid ligase II